MAGRPDQAGGAALLAAANSHVHTQRQRVRVAKSSGQQQSSAVLPKRRGPPVLPAPRPGVCPVLVRSHLPLVSVWAHASAGTGCKVMTGTFPLKPALCPCQREGETDREAHTLMLVRMSGSPVYYVLPGTVQEPRKDRTRCGNSHAIRPCFFKVRKPAPLNEAALEAGCWLGTHLKAAKGHSLFGSGCLTSLPLKMPVDSEIWWNRP